METIFLHCLIRLDGPHRATGRNRTSTTASRPTTMHENIRAFWVLVFIAGASCEGKASET